MFNASVSENCSTIGGGSGQGENLLLFSYISSFSQVLFHGIFLIIRNRFSNLHLPVSVCTIIPGSETFYFL
jgi:hypothetical protein